MEIQSNQLNNFIKYLTDELGGDWLLVGGSLVKLLFDPTRGTEDIDFVKIHHSEYSEEKAKLLLYEWLTSQGLGPEWVNTAADAFVYEVPEWKNEVILINKGEKGQLYRPSITLFVYLKLRRCSEIDIEDCKKAISYCQDKEKLSYEKLKSWGNKKVLDNFKKFEIIFSK